MHSGDLVPFQEFGSLSLQLLMDELAAAEAHKETKRRGERKVWKHGKAYLDPGNLLHKSFAHYHIVMERRAYISTPAPACTFFVLQTCLSVWILLVLLGLIWFEGFSI